MDVTLLIAIALSFGFSFVFALGGVGAAVALVPILSSWLGLPMSLVKPTALLGNTLSMTGASINNIKHKRLDWKAGFPLIISSMALAPVGAYLSQFLSRRSLIILFILFLVFSSSMMLFYKKKKTEQNKPFDKWYTAIVGAIAGSISGLLGVGGGSIISPLLITKGYDPKKVATITAFAIPFSSLTGFFAYLSMGKLDFPYLISCSLAAFVGGMLGTIIMQKYVKPQYVKIFLAFLLIIMAIKMVSSII